MDLMQNHRIQEYISSICSQIKNSKVHNEIKAELISHIEENMDEYMAQGFSDEEAAEKVISKMGDATCLGKQFNKIHKASPDWTTLILALVFTGFGILTMYFIQAKGAILYNDEVFIKSLLYSAFGAIAAAALYFWDYRQLKNYSKYIYIGAILLLIYAFLKGERINGVVWITGFTPINVCRVAPFLFVVALSGIFCNWDWKNLKSAICGMGLALAPAILILFTGPSLSAFTYSSVAFMTIAFVSGMRLKHLLAVIGSGLSLAILYMIQNPFYATRLFAFLFPSLDPHTDGWQYIQLSKIMRSAGLFGQGFTFSPYMLPEAHLHFVFAYIVYTLGWLAGSILIALVIAFLLRLSFMARGIKDKYGKLLIIGFSAIFIVQFMWNILMHLGLAPLGGVILPFISYGGSEIFISLLALGMITSVYKQRSIFPSDMENKNTAKHF